LVRNVVDWDDYVGRFEAVQDVTVTPRVSGTIASILFRNGQDVTANQPLFVIDPRPFRAVYLQAIADLSKAQLKRLSVAAQDGMARAISPAHSPVDGDIVFAREADDRLAVRDQMIADQALGSGGKHVGDVLQMRHPEPPGGCALCVVEDGARHVHRRESFR